MTSIVKEISSMRVSSVLNRNAKEYGKQYMTDNCEDTCWNSDQGTPQWVLLNFSHDVTVEELLIQFQGGFAGKECWIEGKSDGVMNKISSIYPEDTNTFQVFPLPHTVTDSIKVVFNSSTDFYGRIIIYKLDVKGKS